MSQYARTPPPRDQSEQALPNVARRHWITLGSAYVLLGAAAWILAQFVDADDWWVHGLWCVIGLAVALPALVRAVGDGFANVLGDHRVVFLGAFALYFLFGAALLAFGSEIQVDSALRYYPIAAHEAMRVNAINAAGFGIAILSATLSPGRWMWAQAARAAGLVARVPDAVVVGSFLLIGGACSAYVLAYDLGFREGTVPGVVRITGKLVYVALFLAAMHRGRLEWSLRLSGVALMLLVGVGGLVQFNKLEVLLAVAAFVAGLALRFGSRKVLTAGLAALGALYLLLGDVTSYGRSAVRYEGATTISERWRIFRDTWRDTRELTESEEYGAWARLCYTPPQMAAIDYWDTGEGGDGFKLLPWVFVPRAAVSDKPEITKTGRDFNAKITGQDTSSTGQGIFVSGYYHGGPWGFIFASIVCGWILAQTSAVARAVMNRRALLLLPFGLLGMFIAFRIDGDFVSDYVGAFVFILYPVAALSLVSAAVGGRHGVASRSANG